MELSGDIEHIYKGAIEDPTLLSTIDIDSLLDKIGENHYLEGKTLDDVSKEIYDAIFSLGLTEEKTKEYCMRLIGYRPIDKLCDLRNGRLTRWIKKNSGSLTNGGLLVNVKIENTGIILLCKNNTNRFFNVRFDDSVVFQKLTMEEQIVLMANK